MTIRKIAENTSTTMEQVYKTLNRYCNENGYNVIIRTKNGVKFETEGNEINKNLRNAREIKAWVYKNGRRPRAKIKREKTTQDKEKEIKLQEEARLGYTLNTIIHNIMEKYGSIELGKIEDEEDREIVQIIREINIRYGKNRTASLLNAREIEDWVEENGRKPRKQIKGIKTTQNIEEETEEQRELRLGKALYWIVKT